MLSKFTKLINGYRAFFILSIVIGFILSVALASTSVGLVVVPKNYSLINVVNITSDNYVFQRDFNQNNTIYLSLKPEVFSFKHYVVSSRGSKNLLIKQVNFVTPLGVVKYNLVTPILTAPYDIFAVSNVFNIELNPAQVSNKINAAKFSELFIILSVLTWLFLQFTRLVTKLVIRFSHHVKISAIDNYLILLALNLIFFNHYLVNSLKIALPSYHYFAGVVIYFNPYKKLELLEYLFGTIWLALWFILVIIAQRKLTTRVRRYMKTSINGFFSRVNWVVCYATLLIINVLVYNVINNFASHAIFAVLIQLLCLLASITLPVWSYLTRFGYTGIFNSNSKRVISKQNNLALSYVVESKRQKIAWSLLSLVAFSFLVYIFYNPIVKNPKIINEYFNIPEQTIIKANGETKLVENAAYWQQYFVSNKMLKESVSLFNLNHELASQHTVDVDTNEAKLFMDANQYEIRWQLASRFMIHHNSFMFIPISSLMLHESSAHVSAQYGLGNAKLFAYAFNKFGDLSFDNWLRVSYGFYLVYFLMLILVSALITRSYVWTAIILVVSLTIENLHGYDFLLLPPGDSPWRNLLDLLSLLMMFIYSRQKSFIFYVIALFLGFVSIIFNPQIGIMILVATILSGVFYAIYERLNIKHTLILSISTLVVAFYLYTNGVSHDDLVKYYLDGVLGDHVSFTSFLLLFIVISVLYLAIREIINRQFTRNYVYLIFLIIYSQELLLYAIWHFNIGGFLTRGYIYVITLLLLVFQFKDYCSVNLKKMLCIIALGVYGYSVIFMLQSKYQYDKIFDQHVIYNWNLDRAHITSTMNPVYFENGVKLIEKYSKNQNGIYIISEYDNFLPFLSHKYSLMPFFDMKWYMVTPKELNKTIDLLKTKQPKYLFVDTGIDLNLNNEIIDSSVPTIGYLNQESVWRVQRLKLLNLVFQSVALNYTIVESGCLISVYKRIN